MSILDTPVIYIYDFGGGVCDLEPLSPSLVGSDRVGEDLSDLYASGVWTLR